MAARRQQQQQHHHHHGYYQNLNDDTHSLATLGSFGSASWVANQFDGANVNRSNDITTADVQTDESVEFKHECTSCARAFRTLLQLHTHLQRDHHHQQQQAQTQTQTQTQTQQQQQQQRRRSKTTTTTTTTTTPTPTVRRNDQGAVVFSEEREAEEEEEEDGDEVESGNGSGGSLDKSASGHRGFKCPHCGKCFTRRSEMGRHVGSQHDNRTSFLHCEKCSFKHEDPEQFHKHVADKHKRCKYCRNQFKQLKKHENSCYLKPD